MKFFNFADIISRCDCRDIARDWYGCKINGSGRCAALWRGGDDPENVSIEKERWFDHVEKRGGGVIQLAAFRFGGDVQQAQAALGEALGLTPTMETGRQPQECRYEELLRAGYVEVARYDYRDAAGALVHFVVRLQHPDKPGKEFCQGVPTEDGGVKWGLHGVTTLLYRLDVALASSWVAIVEGEKSADRMNSIGIPAVSCCGGAKKWHDALSDALRGKDVAIFPDNDAPGAEHAAMVAASLHGKARTVKIVPPAACLPSKAGVDDYLDTEGGHTADDVLALIVAAPEWHPAASLIPSDNAGPTPAMLAEAKAANSIPFRNYIPVEKETEKRGRKTKETAKEPRTHQAMLDDLARRFLSFPRKTGKRSLFDFDRDTGKIIELDWPVQLKSWIGRKSKHNAEFAHGDGFVTEQEFFESVTIMAHQYESISLVPDWPRRPEVYYAHESLPPPSEGHKFLNDFIDFFMPATEFDRHLIKAFVCCPLWYIPGVSRPSWIIDTRDAQGSGKSTMVELVAELYGAPPITVCKSDLERDQKEIRKRCVSRSGRNSRVFLVDNVSGNFRCPELAALMTYKHISGMAPYGHGEESRENNLVFCITANSATVDTDIADRCLYIYICQPTYDRNGWKERIQTYICRYRLNIISDIINMISNHKSFGIKTRTRFAEFEDRILQPCCGDPETFISAVDHVFSLRAESNIEEEFAKAITEAFNYNLSQCGIEEGNPVFIHSHVVNSWGGTALADIRDKKHEERPVQIIKNLAKKRLLPMVDATVRQWPPTSRSQRFAGVAWNFADTTEVAPLVTFDGNGPDKKVIVKHMIGGTF